MSESISTWNGRVIDNDFPLADFIGGTETSAVYRTTFSGQNAAIKLLADGGNAEALLAHFTQAAKLSHPNLLRILKSGRTNIDGSEFVYAVTEFAEENLSQVLPERALTPQETRDVLAATLQALQYLHQQGFVHADLKPANIMAAHDQLKLSIDGVHRIGEPLSRDPGVHDAPEAQKALTPASDVWSLGVTLIEVLTRKLPPQPASENVGPAVPESVPAPFREIAQHCLLRTPELRWSIVEIQKKLDPEASKPVDTARPVVDTARPVVDAGRPRPVTSKRPFIFVAIMLIIAAAIIALPRLSHHEPPAVTTPAPVSTEAPAPQATSEQRPQSTNTESTASPPLQAKTAEPDTISAPPPSQTMTAAKHISDEPVEVSPDEADNTPVETSAAKDVVHQVMPEVIPQARRSITGKVRVKLRVNVDPAGNVVDSEFLSPGPSKYFARVAKQAAERWKFTPASTQARAWNIEFDFRRSGTKVHSTPQENR